MRQVNIGVVGCGWAGMMHLRSLIQIDGANVVALATANEARMNDALALVPHARTYPTAEAMLAGERELDAVILNVTPARHDGLEQLFAARGVHLYIEKPIELDWARAEAIERAIKDAGIIASVGYQERYNPSLAKARDLLAGRRPYLAEARWMGHVVGAPWWRAKAESGGQIIEQSTHLFDMLRFLLGDGRVLSAAAVPGPAPGAMQNDVEPLSVATVAMDCGAVAQVTTGCFLDPAMKSGIDIKIWCEDARFEMDWSGELRLITPGHTELITVPSGHHKQAMQAFIDAVRTGDRSLVLSDYADAMRTFRMTLDAQRMVEDQF